MLAGVEGGGGVRVMCVVRRCHDHLAASASVPHFKFGTR